MKGVVGDLAASVVGRALVTLAELIARVQTALGLQARARSLTVDERDLLWNVYRDSIVYDRVRIVEGMAGVFSINPRPFTLGDTIYLKGVDPRTDPSILVHECCHVWQHQHEGSAYAVRALVAQATVRPSAYRWEDELGRGRVSWREFNKEAQAELLQDVFRSGTGGSSRRKAGSFYDGDPIVGRARFERHDVDYTDLAKAAIEYVRAAPPTR